MSTVENEIPEVGDGSPGHARLHNTIRRVLIAHERRLDDLTQRVARLEPRNWIPEQPGDDRPPRQGPELPEQPPRDEAPPPEYPAGTGEGNGGGQW